MLYQGVGHAHIHNICSGVRQMGCMCARFSDDKLSPCGANGIVSFCVELRYYVVVVTCDGRTTRERTYRWMLELKCVQRKYLTTILVRITQPENVQIKGWKYLIITDMYGRVAGWFIGKINLIWFTRKVKQFCVSCIIESDDHEITDLFKIY